MTKPESLRLVRPDSARRRLSAWATVGCALLVLSSCSGTGTSTPSAPGVIFQDDFSNTTSGWDRHTGADLTTDYVDGRYVVEVVDPGVDVWARPGLNLADVEFEAETQYIAGPDNNEFGLICRYERAGDGRNSFYFFFVSSDGYYALGKVVRDARTILSPGEGSFQPTDAVQLGADAVNVLTATCSGTHFALAVNATLVGEFDDTELARGDVGVIAGTFDEGGVHIAFDNVIVRSPEQE
jgi:hypothetical protein